MNDTYEGQAAPLYTLMLTHRRTFKAFTVLRLSWEGASFPCVPPWQDPDWVRWDSRSACLVRKWVGRGFRCPLLHFISPRVVWTQTPTAEEICSEYFPQNKSPVQLAGIRLQFSHLFTEQIFIQCLLSAWIYSVHGGPCLHWASIHVDGTDNYTFNWMYGIIAGFNKKKSNRRR